MLTDDDAATVNQSDGSFVLSGDVEPGVGVLHIHDGVGINGTQAEEEGSVAGDDFCVGISADVADLDVAVGILVVGAQLAVSVQFGDLHAGDDTGSITSLVDLGESVMEVGQAGSLGGVAGHGDDLNVGIFLGNLLRKGLVAIGVGEDQRASLIDAVNNGIVAGLVFLDGVLPDNVVSLIQTEVGNGFLDAQDMCIGVAFVLVAHKNNTDFDIGTGDDGVVAFTGVVASVRVGAGVGVVTGGGVCRFGIPISSGAAHEHNSHQGNDENESQNLFHFCSSLNSFGPESI